LKKREDEDENEDGRVESSRTILLRRRNMTRCWDKINVDTSRVLTCKKLPVSN
jgi:hypothetical protein